MTNEEVIKTLTDEIVLIKRQIYPQDLETTIWVENRIHALEIAINAVKNLKEIY